MTSQIRSVGKTATQTLLLACSFLLIGALLYNHYQLITFTVPLDYNEAGMLSVTATIAEGRNPYAFENQPTHAVVYPALYNILVAPITLLVGNTLPLHRAVAGALIILSCGLCYLVLRRQGNSRLEGLAAATLWYGALLYYSTPIASPNSLGVVLFFASIAIPWLYQFSNRSLAVALALGVLAFYGKQYQIACLGYVALYLFISVSKKRAILFGMAALLLFLLTLGAVALTSPFFLDNTVFAVHYVADRFATFKSAFSQLLEFSLINAPLLAILTLQASHSVIARHVNSPNAALDTPDKGRALSVNFADLDAPLLNVRANYFWLCLICSLLVIVFVIGKNPANHLTYLFQILSPFLLIVSFQCVARSDKLKPVYYALIIATLYTHYAMLSKDFSIDNANWDKVKQLIADTDEVFVSTLVLPEIIGTGKEVYDNGHTRYFYHAEEKPRIFAHGSPDEDITQMWTQYVKQISAKIKAQEFDLILLDQWMPLPKPSPRSDFALNPQALLRKHYYSSERFTLELAKRPGGGGYEVEVWRPKLDAGAEARSVPE